MPLDNSLNVSELLRRLGVKGDSQGSASLLEALRLNVMIGDLSDLVPPVAVPIGGFGTVVTSGVGTAIQVSLQCRSPGGLKIGLIVLGSTQFAEFWITEANPFAAPVAEVTANYAFGQVAQSIVFTHPAAAKVAPLDVIRLPGITVPLGPPFFNWVGPGQFFNCEFVNTNIANQTFSIMWKELPGALNP